MRLLGGLLAAFLAPGGKATSTEASSRVTTGKTVRAAVSAALGAPESVREAVWPLLFLSWIFSSLQLKNLTS